MLLLAACGATNDINTADPDLEEHVGFTFDGKRALEVFGDGYPLTVRDYLDVETILESKPQRVAVLSGTPMNIWYDLGGKSVCTSEISANLKLIPEYSEELLALPTIGAVYSINMEAVIEQEPDLIIAQFGTQNVQAAKLRSMGYNVITTYIRSFDDVISAYLTFGSILEVNAVAEAKAAELISTRNELISMSPRDDASVVILYLTANALSVKLDNSIAGDVAINLGLQNIASELPPDSLGSENALLDIEYVVSLDPDIVLVTSMISDNATAVEKMEEIFVNNPIWRSLRAVREGSVVYLPQEYFLYNAGPYYCEAVEYLARSVYPEIYGEAGEWYESNLQ